jgi:hypothetical protein
MAEDGRDSLWRPIAWPQCLEHVFVKIRRYHSTMIPLSILCLGVEARGAHV